MNDKALTSIIDSISGDIALATTREKILAVEGVLEQLPQIDIPVIHRHTGGIYAREITIPKGTMLTGKVYKDAHFDVMVSGDITVTSDDGRQRLTGFHVFEGKQGKKRAGYAHEDTQWVTFHACEPMPEDDYIKHLACDSFVELDSDLIERDYVKETDIKKAFKSQPSYRKESYLDFRSGFIAAKGKPSKVDLDHYDYAATLKDYGFTETVVRAQTETTTDRVDVESDCLVLPSDIQGKGLYAQSPIKAGQVIMPARVAGMRTIAGRYVNHSFDPNATMGLKEDGDMDLIALKPIFDEEITVNYRTVLSLQITRVA